MTEPLTAFEKSEMANRIAWDAWPSSHDFPERDAARDAALHAIIEMEERFSKQDQPTWTEENEPARILKNTLFALERQKAPTTVYGGVLTDDGRLAWVSYQLLPQGQLHVTKTGGAA